MGDAPIDAKSSRADDEADPAGAAPDMLKEEGVAWTGARRLLRAPLEVGGSSDLRDGSVDVEWAREREKLELGSKSCCLSTRLDIEYDC
jgi:hypothetical protein